jgi:hypothetical protein
LLLSKPQDAVNIPGAGTSPLSQQMIRFLQEGSRNLFAATTL